MAGLALLAALTVLALPTREQTAPAIRPVTQAPLIVRGTGFLSRSACGSSSAPAGPARRRGTSSPTATGASARAAACSWRSSLARAR
jgi:hypothetical protein